ncbi:MAG: HypC/HybG/HupF family hydrogenase formation chaperone [Roseivivax sp.]|nr:HypC/HybG/HupF family hydrogenase formation chaperone [Roseivivax sp.]
MCVGVPMQILSVTGLAAEARGDEGTAIIDLSLTGPLAPGTWVLTHLGTARAEIGEQEAQQINAALAGLRLVMAGGTAGDAFADIEARGPQLPPHLQAALERGQKTG